MGAIYIIKNTINKKVYIGQTTQKVEDRFKQHLKLLKSNSNQIIHKAIKKYGKDKFYYEILEYGVDVQDLNKKEEYYIKIYNSVENGYNISYGGGQSRRTPLISSEEDIKDIIALYEDGKSTRYIGDKYSVSNSVIKRILKNNGVRLRSKSCNLPNRSSKITKPILEDLYLRQQLNQTEIAKVLKVSRKSVYDAIKRYNLIRI